MAIVNVQPSIADGQTTLLRKLLQGFFDGRFVGSGGGGGGGGAVTIADGAAVTTGSLADATAGILPGSYSVISLLKGIFSELSAGTIDVNVLNSTLPVVNAPATTLNVTGTLTGVTTVGTITNPVTVAQATAANLKAQVSVASGGIASGALAAGSIAAGAAVSGALVDGAIATLGTEADAVATTLPASYTVISLLKLLISGVTVQGNVGGKTFTAKVNPTISTSAYSAGFTVGAIQTLTGAVTKSGGTGILESLILLDKSNQKAAMDIFIFDVNPVAATTTDHAAFVFSTNDVNVIARVSVAASDYVTVNSEAVAVKSGLGIAVQASGSANLYAVAVTSGTPTYSASALQWVWGILQD